MKVNMVPTESNQLAAALRTRYETKVVPLLAQQEFERARLATLDILTLMQQAGLKFILGVHCGLNAYTALQSLCEELRFGCPSAQTYAEATAFLRQTKLLQRPFGLEDFLDGVPVVAVPARAAAEGELVYH